MPHRFYCAALNGDNATLDGSEAHHALHVLRLQVGDAVTLFDGHGIEAVGRVAELSRRAVVVSISSVSRQERLANLRLSVAAAVPKGDRLKFLVEKLTEIGVDHFVPLQTARSVVDPRQTKLDRLSATVVAAAKQCQRSWLMTIAEPASLAFMLRAAQAAGHRICMAHPHAEHSVRTPNQSAGETLLLIGPEGGFTDEEVAEAVQFGAQSLSWPRGILRIETAALVFASLLLAEREGFLEPRTGPPSPLAT